MTDKLIEFLRDNKMRNGRLLFYSKSKYRKANPTHPIVFNAEIHALDGDKIWHGDLDLYLDSEILLNASKIESFYVTYECSSEPIVIFHDGLIKISLLYTKYFKEENERLVLNESGS